MHGLVNLKEPRSGSLLTNATRAGARRFQEAIEVAAQLCRRHPGVWEASGSRATIDIGLTENEPTAALAPLTALPENGVIYSRRIARCDRSGIIVVPGIPSGRNRPIS